MSADDTRTATETDPAETDPAETTDPSETAPQPALRPYEESGDEQLTRAKRQATRVRRAWMQSLNPGAQSAMLSWTAFTTTFATARAITHWIRSGHGPSGGGMSLGGYHFHHYNLGIGLLTGVGGLAVRGAERHRRHPMTAIAYGTAVGLIVDELALLLDLEDVYWAKQGRTSVDAAVTIIGAGGVALAGMAFWPEARKALH